MSLLALALLSALAYLVQVRNEHKWPQ